MKSESDYYEWWYNREYEDYIYEAKQHKLERQAVLGIETTFAEAEGALDIANGYIEDGVEQNVQWAAAYDHIKSEYDELKNDIKKDRRVPPSLRDATTSNLSSTVNNDKKKKTDETPQQRQWLRITRRRVSPSPYARKDSCVRPTAIGHRLQRVEKRSVRQLL